MFVVGVDIFAVGESGWVLDRFIRDVKNRERYAAVLERGAKRRRDRGRGIASCPVCRPIASGNFGSRR